MNFAWQEIVAVAATLFFIMDPLGNTPVFHAILKDYAPPARMRIIARELLFALVILIVFLLAGTHILNFLGLSQPSLNIAGGILLFLIALRMVFPRQGGIVEERAADPFIVPLAVPLVAGPSTIAVLLLLSSSQPERMLEWLAALLLAWGMATVILVGSGHLLRWLGDRGLRAAERLMGMLLILIAVEMFLDGVGQYWLALPARG